MRRNREVLAVNDMLEKGGTLAASRVGMDVLAAIAGAVGELEIRITARSEGTGLRARITRSER